MAGFRLQAAIEYITTYGWALLIIALAALALFYLHVFSPAPSSTCVFPAGLSCTSLYLAQNGMLSFTIVQTFSTPINITAAGCNSNTIISNVIMQNVYNPPSNQFQVAISRNYSMNVQCYASGSAYSAVPGSEYIGYLIVNYTPQNSGLPHTVFGSINVKVS